MNKIEEIAKRGNFPEDGVKFFKELYEKAEKTDGAIECIEEAQEVYYKGEAVNELLENLSSIMATDRKSTDMLFLLYCAIKLEEIYKQKGYPNEMYLGVLTDLKCKTIECLDVHGVWGTFVFQWFHRFYLCTRFPLGRLQFEEVGSLCDFKNKVKKGDTVIGCHIPSSGRLLPEEVDKSIRMAYDFYGFKDEMVVQCASWMLFPEYANEGVFPEGTNLRYFYDLFEVVESYTSPLEEGGVWRVFGTNETDVSKLPKDSGLRRRLAEFYEKHDYAGVGRGYFVYKPAK